MQDDTKQTQEVKAKRTAKNSVFLDLFQDKKNLLRLYKTLHPEDTEDIINQYIIFCKVLDEQRKLYGMTEQTVKETIRICKDRNILKEYLISREKEVVTIMMSLFDDEQIMKTYWKDIEKESARKKAKLMLRDGKISQNEISTYFPELSSEDIEEVIGETMQLV